MKNNRYRKVVPFFVSASALGLWYACSITHYESVFTEASLCWLQSACVLSVRVQTRGWATRTTRPVLCVFIVAFQSCKIEVSQIIRTHKNHLLQIQSISLK